METRKRRKYIWAAYRYSFSRLVLNYFLYYESSWDESEGSEKTQRAGEEFDRILEAFLEGKDALEDLDRLRDNVIARLETLTGFSDCFEIYEYVINRMERRFIPMENSVYTSREMAERLVEKIGALKDPAEQHEKIRAVVSQLPIRFTRQKFYGMIGERFLVYAGLRQADVEDLLYMIRTSSMVQLPEHMDEEEELYRCLSDLRNTDYRGLDMEGFSACVGSFLAASRLLMDMVDRLVLLANLVNDLYVLFLTSNEAMVDAVENRNLRKGAARILEAMKNRDRQLLDDGGQEILGPIEGIQEAVEDLIVSGCPEERGEELDKVAKLLSGSSFMPLKEKERSYEAADKAWMERKAKEFCGELDRMFAPMQKSVMRAVMAKVLSKLPVLFQDGEELENYIFSSLESCSDSAEREACMQLLEQELME